MSKARSALTYANVIATVALFLALGGGAYAALKVPKGSVGSGQIKNNSIKSADVKDKSLLSKDFKPGQLPAGAQGAPSAPGTPGTPGAPGSPGSPAASFLGPRFQEVAGTVYATPVGSSTASVTESGVSMVSPASPIVARDLFVLSDDSPADDRSYTLTVNGTATSLSCTIPPSSFGNDHTSCSDAADAITIPPGSTISLRFLSCSNSCAGGGTGTRWFARVGWRATTP
jgi:hypothetical protein